jgi:hypothetical protein
VLSTFGWALLCVLLVLGAWSTAANLVFFARQLGRSARWFFSRSLLERESVPAVKRHRVGTIDRPHRRPSSSPPSTHHPHLLAFPFLLVAPGPDVDAFTGGVVLGVSVAFIVIAGLGGVAIVRRVLGS